MWRKFLDGPAPPLPQLSTTSSIDSPGPPPYLSASRSPAATMDLVQPSEPIPDGVTESPPTSPPTSEVGDVEPFLLSRYLLKAGPGNQQEPPSRYQGDHLAASKFQGRKATAEVQLVDQWDRLMKPPPRPMYLDQLLHPKSTINSHSPAPLRPSHRQTMMEDRISSGASFAPSQGELFSTGSELSHSYGRHESVSGATRQYLHAKLHEKSFLSPSASISVSRSRSANRYSQSYAPYPLADSPEALVHEQGTNTDLDHHLPADTSAKDTHPAAPNASSVTQKEEAGELAPSGVNEELPKNLADCVRCPLCGTFPIQSDEWVKVHIPLCYRSRLSLERILLARSVATHSAAFSIPSSVCPHSPNSRANLTSQTQYLHIGQDRFLSEMGAPSTNATAPIVSHESPSATNGEQSPASAPSNPQGQGEGPSYTNALCEFYRIHRQILSIHTKEPNGSEKTESASTPTATSLSEPYWFINEAALALSRRLRLPCPMGRNCISHRQSWSRSRSESQQNFIAAGDRERSPPSFPFIDAGILREGISHKELASHMGSCWTVRFYHGMVSDPTELEWGRKLIGSLNMGTVLQQNIASNIELTIGEALALAAPDLSHWVKRTLPPLVITHLRGQGGSHQKPEVLTGRSSTVVPSPKSSPVRIWQSILEAEDEDSGSGKLNDEPLNSGAGGGDHRRSPPGSESLGQVVVVRLRDDSPLPLDASIVSSWALDFGVYFL
jgi:hypothetical protein